MIREWGWLAWLSLFVFVFRRDILISMEIFHGESIENFQQESAERAFAVVLN